MTINDFFCITMCGSYLNWSRDNVLFIFLFYISSFDCIPKPLFAFQDFFTHGNLTSHRRRRKEFMLKKNQMKFHCDLEELKDSTVVRRLAS